MYCYFSSALEQWWKQITKKKQNKDNAYETKVYLDTDKSDLPVLYFKKNKNKYIFI